MAASDYEIRAVGSFTSVATLSQGVGPHDTHLEFTSQKSAAGDEVKAGEGVLIGGEFMRIEGINGTGMSVARGCLDTIPRVQQAGTPIWFYDGGLYGDTREYTVGEKIAVKLPTRTIGNGIMEVKDAPPNDLVFVGRFARPYPPGNVRINGDRWTRNPTLTKQTGDTQITWNSRNRIIQADKLIGHDENSVVAEAGTEYLLGVGLGGAAAFDTRILTTTSSTYTRQQLRTIFSLTTSDQPIIGNFTLAVRRDGFLSRDVYNIPFIFVPSEA